MNGQVILDPLVPVAVAYGIAVFAVVVVALGLWRGLSGWWLRLLGAAVLVVGLLNPSLQTEDREPLTDIVIAVVDDSASQGLSDRADQTAAALTELEAAIAARPLTELRIVRRGDGADNAGTELMTALAEALAEVPEGRVAGIFLLSDGQVHDLDRAPRLPAPLHLVRSGQPDDWDRRLEVTNAPAFAILGEPVVLGLRVSDDGAVPRSDGLVALNFAIDGGPPSAMRVPVGQDIEVPITLTHGGRNVLQFWVEASDGELTDRNNAAVVQINGVRDRLRVLLVSGEPHPGQRTWRNLLKSDSSVDLVHFTILRPPEKQDRVPVDELSLIAFPTRELFLEKIDEFDLIIFDRYQRRGILPGLYFDNIRQYVENGGAVLVAAGPDYAAATSIYRSPLGLALPAGPTARVVEEPFFPQLTELGNRHPVTEGLDGLPDNAPPGSLPDWGRWFRLTEVEPDRGTTVMSGPDERPLLILDRVGEGRVALLTSDHAWLWSRGYEGGGPQLELLRRLAHWMMGEPELEEEALTANAVGQTMQIERRTLGEGVGPVTVVGPEGASVVVELTESRPGRWVGTYEAPEIGLYRLSDGIEETVIGLGPSSPREFEAPIASSEPLSGLMQGTNGGTALMSDAFPQIRAVREGRPAAGRGWLGVTPREAYLTADVRVTALLPSWLFLLIASALIIGAWLREGRA